MGPSAISSQIVRNFALKVATPGSQAMFLDEDNRNAGFASIAEAARNGRPFCVDVRLTILALDGDDPTLQPELEKVAADLRAEGFEPVLVLSGGTGRHHLFCLITDPRAKRAYRDRVHRLGFGSRLEVRPKIRPPLSPHRHGLPVALLRPDDPAEALAALTAFRRSAYYEGRILKGPSPPIYRWSSPPKFELVINLKTTKPSSHLD